MSGQEGSLGRLLDGGAGAVEGLPEPSGVAFGGAGESNFGGNLGSPVTREGSLNLPRSDSFKLERESSLSSSIYASGAKVDRNPSVSSSVRSFGGHASGPQSPTSSSTSLTQFSSSAPAPSSPVVRRLLAQQQAKQEQLRAKLGGLKQGPGLMVEDVLNPDFKGRTWDAGSGNNLDKFGVGLFDGMEAEDDEEGFQDIGVREQAKGSQVEPENENAFLPNIPPRGPASFKKVSGGAKGNGLPWPVDYNDGDAGSPPGPGMGLDEEIESWRRGKSDVGRSSSLNSGRVPVSRSGTDARYVSNEPSHGQRLPHPPSHRNSKPQPINILNSPVSPMKRSDTWSQPVASPTTPRASVLWGGTVPSAAAAVNASARNARSKSLTRDDQPGLSPVGPLAPVRQQSAQPEARRQMKELGSGYGGVGGFAMAGGKSAGGVGSTPSTPSTAGSQERWSRQVPAASEKPVVGARGASLGGGGGTSGGGGSVAGPGEVVGGAQHHNGGLGLAAVPARHGGAGVVGGGSLGERLRAFSGGNGGDGGWKADEKRDVGSDDDDEVQVVGEEDWEFDDEGYDVETLGRRRAGNEV
ncbi:hypothetical protein HK097_010229 [Rhizophlyctis rosea]|uniref:Uncharacterized protein n=1 Tax=Rhizophlyctis rosea TaxID=64517 RepID=A0AAD5SFU5_9FUNG|nr:hypothetical protein HK097_010229 [Rhizophlyctis rosea]